MLFTFIRQKGFQKQVDWYSQFFGFMSFEGEFCLHVWAHKFVCVWMSLCLCIHIHAYNDMHLYIYTHISAICWWEGVRQSELAMTINHLYIYIYIYVYIYIYCHPPTECFVLSELFSVARHVGRLKPGSKPIQLYVRLSFRPLGQQADYVGNF